MDRFPYRYEENTMGHEGSFASVGAVAFRDINDDGKSDIIVIVYYYSGAGPTGMVPRPDIRIFIAEENEFYLAEKSMCCQWFQVSPQTSHLHLDRLHVRFRFFRKSFCFPMKKGR